VRNDPGRLSRLPRWALPAGGGLLAAVAALVLLLLFGPASGGAACAAVPDRAPAGSGTATYYTPAGGGGNCSYVGPPADDLYVALGPAEYAAGAACGGYLDVTGPKGTVRVKVVDQCPECGTGHLDLSKAAFTRIGAVTAGVIPVSYRPVRDPKVPGPLAVRVKEGSSRYWLGLLVIDHGNPLASVEVRYGGGWQALRHTDYNYWLAESGAGPGPFTVRVTDTAGHQVTAAGIALSPQVVQRTTVWMYGGGAPAATRPPASPSPVAPSSPAAPGSPATSPAAAAPSTASATPARCHPGQAS
jgi:expansin (peptidoglycan-binding protein)